MSYIILNNNNSMDISGLLIQTLPPISKPLQRTMVEEIDGRDGDIVTKLGYGAYDKEIEIGLYGDYDINEIIKYFDSDGVAIFSDEPDKYYHYQILDQIDYERLIRYRTAKVTFHCQPFKYEVDETPIDTTSVSSITVTNKGNTIAKPTMTIYGTGNISVSLNGSQIFAITLDSQEYVTINITDMEATYGGVLMNRNVVGDYDSFYLNVGENSLAFEGNVSRVQIELYSRWI